MFAMYDYVEISKYLSNGYYDRSKVNKFGELFDRHSSMKVSYNKDERILSIRGSLPYFIQGHNFWFDIDEAKKAVEKISDLLKVDLYDAEIKIMEYGVVVMPNFKIQEFIDSHIQTRGYREEIYIGRGKNYVRNDRAFTLKFYSLWANIDSSWNKVTPETRKMLENSRCCRANNPMRYEIHGSPKKILGARLLVSDMLTEIYEDSCKKALLKKYIQIKKWERMDIRGMKRLDTSKILLTLLSEKHNRFQEELLKMVDRTSANIYSKRSRKNHIKKLCRKIPHERCSYSIENLILEVISQNKTL
ncbi:MAG: hypothetical protein VB102_12205 [Paludibacter sp.]|nr:hypothetical protein [Paludibacter sp.]